MSKRKLFVLSFVVTACVLLAFAAYKRLTGPRLGPPELDQVADGLFVTGQLNVRDFSYLRGHGVKTVVDCRPDGEAYDQTPSGKMEQWAKTLGMDFYYIPVPHGDVPDSAVDTLGTVLAQQKPPTVLYCRTGNRAMRTLALVEASRPGGPNADAIAEMVRRAGFSPDELKGNIDQRIANRNKPQEKN